jgi:uncharacterized protein DUF5317
MLLSGVVAGLALGIAIGREWRRLERLQIKWLPVLVLALVARAIAPLGPFALPLDLLGIALTCALAAANWRLPGAPLIAIGSLLNLAVIVANGAMPVDVDALGAAGSRLRDDALHEPLNDHSILPILADIIIVPFVRAAYSIGDVFIAIGGFLVPFVTLTRR